MDKKNRIIVLIDFSENSENLVDFAFTFSKIINAKVVLIHKTMSFVPAFSDQATRDEIIKSEIEEAYGNLRKFTKGRFHNPDSIIVSEKPLLTILNNISRDYYFDWVFTGLKDAGTFKKMVIGSTPITIVNDSDFLVVAIPLSTPVTLPKKLMVGVNHKYPLNKHQFNTVLRALKDQIRELVFFTIIKEDEDEMGISKGLLYLKEEYKDFNPFISFYKGRKDAFEILKEEVALKENSFLVIQQGPRSFSDKIFRNFMINDLAYFGQFPFIVLSK